VSFALAALAGLALAQEPPAAAPAPAEPPPPERLGKPLTSLAAAPAWWQGPQALDLGQARAYAPESPDAGALYQAASAGSAEPGPLDGGALACDLDLGERRFDELVPFASEESTLGDIAALAGVSPDRRKAPALVVGTYGPEDRNQVVLLLPLARLQVGDTLWIRLVDMDVSLHDDVETLRVRYDGKLPLALAGRLAKGTCRLVTRPALEVALARRLGYLDQALEKLAAGARPDFLDGVVTGVEGFLSDARESALGAAALVGWDDPRVLRRVLRLGELEAGAARAYAQAFEALRASAAGPAWAAAPAGRLEVRVDGLRCGRRQLGLARALVAFPEMLPADACALYLSLRNTGAEPLEFGIHAVGPLRDLTLVSARGRSRPVSVEGQLLGGRARKFRNDPRLEPGQAMEVVVVPEPEEEVLRRSSLPLLLRGAPAPGAPLLFWRVPEPSPAAPVKRQGR